MSKKFFLVSISISHNFIKVEIFGGKVETNWNSENFARRKEKSILIEDLLYNRVFSFDLCKFYSRIRSASASKCGIFFASFLHCQGFLQISGPKWTLDECQRPWYEPSCCQRPRAILCGELPGYPLLLNSKHHTPTHNTILKASKVGVIQINFQKKKKKWNYTGTK